MNAKTSTIGSAPIKDARVLGKPKMLILGLQHMFAMFGATVLVPILVQSYGLPLNTQTTLFFAGFGTLFFRFWAASRPWRSSAPACTPPWSPLRNCSMPAAAS